MEGGRGRAFFFKKEEPEPGKQVPIASMAGRGRAFQMLMEQSRPATAESTESGSNPTESSSLSRFSGTPSPIDGSDSSRSSPRPGVSPKVESPDVGRIPQPVVMGRGRGFLGFAPQPPASAVSSESVPIKKTPEPSTVDSLTSLMTRSLIGVSETSAVSLKSDKPIHMTGVTGQTVPVMVNYIRLSYKKNFGTFEYEIKFEPEEDNKSSRIKMLREHAEFLGRYTFDGSVMYRPTKLPQDITMMKSSHPLTQEPVSIKLIYKKSKRLSDMKHLFNILFKRIMIQLKMVEFRRQYYDPKASQSIPQYKLEIWPGYVTAVDEYEGGLMLCINPSHRVLRQQSVLELIKEEAQNSPHNWQNQAKAALIGQTVMTTYNNKSYRIDEIDFSMNPLSEFNGKTGITTFVQYYKNNYGITIKDLKQPLLVHRKEQRKTLSQEPEVLLICLIPELCNMTGITDEMKTNMNLMKNMAMYTRITPNQRIAAIQTFIDNVNRTPAAKQVLEDWGLELDPSCIQMNARTLPPEQIVFGDNLKIAGNMDADWGRDITRNKCISVMDIRKWALIYTKKDTQFSKTFTDTLMHCTPPMGLRVSAPQTVCLESDRPEAYSEALKRVIRGKLDIVVCICPTMRDDRYSAIKMTCCVTDPIPSQVINSRTLSNPKKLRSVVQKIALQMNCKMGGTLWAVNIPIQNVMVIGIDVYHGGAKSCAAFVASTNYSMTRWYSVAMFQEAGQELIDSMKLAFIDALRAYSIVNGDFPSKIIIYRDGVGEGQFETTRNFEVQQLETCFPLINDNYKPLMAFIIVHKRINTRVFLQLNRGQLDNPAPGTIVDHTVTRKHFYDFFLVSQKVRQGTVTPTHYVVIHDTTGMAPDHLQRITYKLCHLYYNWPGTVRVPAPCQYAHKLASLIGQSVRKKPSDSLIDKLFYL